MLGIDISTLSLSELRRLLVLAEAREQDALAAQLRAELATRGPDGRPPARPSAAIGDAPDAWTPAPMHFERPEPELELHRMAEREQPRRRWLIAGGVAAAGMLTAAAVAWGPGVASRLPHALARQPAAASAPQRAMVARPVPTPVEAEPVAATEPTIPAADPTQAPGRDEAPPSAVPAGADTAVAKPRRLDPCATPATPADRLVCNDLALDMLDHEMREAYARALNANADPSVVGEGQAAWRRTRDQVSDPQALAQLYDRRIRELDAAAGVVRAEPERD